MVEGQKIFNRITAVEQRGGIPADVRNIVCDSRLVQAGDLFIALVGSSFDGHDFLDEAAKRGACAAVVQTFTSAPLPQIRVADTLEALPILAANFFAHPARELKLAGVTGSNGKTTSTYLLESIWKEAGERTGVLGTIEYRFADVRRDAPNTTPLPHLMQGLLREIADTGVQRLVMEVSSHGLALHRVDEMKFDAALFTNLSQDHLDFHPDMEHYRRTKIRLFSEFLKQGRPAVINSDDEAGRKMIREIHGRRIVTYGIQDVADVIARNLDIGMHGSTFEIAFPDIEIPVETGLIGRFNVYNVLGAAALAWACGTPVEAIWRGIAKMKNVPGRMETVPNRINAQVVVDYSHTPDALDKCLRALKAIPHQRIITLFGCGGDRDKTKRPQMGAIALAHSDRVIVTSDNPRTENPDRIIEDIETGMREQRDRYTIISDRREALKAGVKELREGDIFLIAGKGHETYQILGREKTPFDDREITRNLLIESGKGKGGGTWL